jgi:hypothetical protein
LPLPKPRKNRFAPEASDPSPASGAGPGLFLDVEGHVRFDGTTPKQVTVFGVTHDLDADGRVNLGPTRYALVTVDGRACLAPVGAAPTNG